MAKAQYIGVNNVARKVTKQYVGVDNVARQITKGYIGVNNVAREYFTAGTPVSELEIGSSVYMNINGIPTEFIVVQQGNPDESIYDSSCDGTWLLAKETYGEKKDWGRPTEDNMLAYINDYSKSGIHNYLNNEVLPLFENSSAIKQVKLPYNTGLTDGNTLQGTNGLLTSIFILSVREYGHTLENDWIWKESYDGVCLSYFSTNDVPLKGIWTRTPYKINDTDRVHAWYCGSWIKDFDYDRIDKNKGICPALILSSDTLFDDNFNIIS